IASRITPAQKKLRAARSVMGTSLLRVVARMYAQPAGRRMICIKLRDFIRHSGRTRSHPRAAQAVRLARRAGREGAPLQEQQTRREAGGRSQATMQYAPCGVP